MKWVSIGIFCLAAVGAVGQERSENERQNGTIAVERSRAAQAAQADASARRPHGVEFQVAPAQGSVQSNGRQFTPTPLYEPVGSPRAIRWRTSSEWSSGGVVLEENGRAPRTDYRIGIRTGGIRGGGCFPANPDDPASPCLTQTDAAGNSSIVWKEREMWTWRISYIDPDDPNAVEENIGFIGSFGYVGDTELQWVRRTEGNHSCFTFYPCDYYGLNLNEVTSTVNAFEPGCHLKLGPGFKMQIFYRYSRYRFGEVPAGAEEWQPAITPATATRLEIPGKELFVRNFELEPSPNALSISFSKGVVHPKVERFTGYPTVAPTIAEGSAEVTVRSYDCEAIPGVSFTIDRTFVAASGGHDHTNQPNLDRVGSLGSYSGTTNDEGEWTTTFTAGDLGSALTFKVSSPDLLGKPFTSYPVDISVGFLGLFDPGIEYGDVDVRYTGATTAHGSNHNGTPELHQMVRDMAVRYNIEADDAVKGSIGLNDMSLDLGGLFDIAGAWERPHSRHRFGTDCDIDRFVQREDGTFVFLDRMLLREIVLNALEGVFLLESGNRMHVQVPEFQVGDILLRGTR